MCPVADMSYSAYEILVNRCLPGGQECLVYLRNLKNPKQLLPSIVKGELKLKIQTGGQMNTLASALNDQNDIKEYKHPFTVSVDVSSTYHSYSLTSGILIFLLVTVKKCTNIVLLLHEGALSRARF